MGAYLKSKNYHTFLAKSTFEVLININVENVQFTHKGALKRFIIDISRLTYYRTPP